MMTFLCSCESKNVSFEKFRLTSLKLTDFQINSPTFVIYASIYMSTKMFVRILNNVHLINLYIFPLFS